MIAALHSLQALNLLGRRETVHPINLRKKYTGLITSETKQLVANLLLDKAMLQNGQLVKTCVQARTSGMLRRHFAHARLDRVSCRSAKNRT